MRTAMQKDPLFVGMIEYDMIGCVCPVSCVDMVTGERDSLYAYMHLNEENLGVGVVAHECLHVAFAHERMMMFNMIYGDGCGRDEERIAYHLTDIIRGVYEVLNKNGHIKKGKNGNGGCSGKKDN